MDADITTGRGQATRPAEPPLGQLDPEHDPWPQPWAEAAEDDATQVDLDDFEPV